MGDTDESILAAAAAEGLTLVTYDQKTIMRILVQYGYIGVDHGGVIFIDDLSIAAHGFSGINQALTALRNAGHDQSWANAVSFLRRAE
jgi:hypothetical protein